MTRGLLDNLLSLAKELERCDLRGTTIVSDPGSMGFTSQGLPTLCTSCHKPTPAWAPPSAPERPGHQVCALASAGVMPRRGQSPSSCPTSRASQLLERMPLVPRSTRKMLCRDHGQGLQALCKSAAFILCFALSSKNMTTTTRIFHNSGYTALQK